MLANVRMLKSSLFNNLHFFKIKVKDSGVLNFSFLIMNHFVYACMEWKGRREGIYQNAITAYSQERRSKFRIFGYVIVTKRVTRKLAKLLKPSHLNYYLMRIYLQNYRQPPGVLYRKCVIKNFENSQKNTSAEAFFK